MKQKMTWLIKQLKGLITVTIIALVLTLGVIVLTIVNIPRLIPLQSIKKNIGKLSNEIGSLIVATLKLSIKVIHRPKWEFELPENLETSNWYIGMSNHLSWGDIFILLFAGHRKVPLLKFFMKDELKWIPILYLVHKTVDMPFLKRHSMKNVKKNPELRTLDMIAAQKAAKRFARNPSVAFSFAEGTRYTPQKHATQRSPYFQLLKPKIGALNIALSGMPEVTHLLDFTIIYKTNKTSAWNFVCGDMNDVQVIVQKHQLPKEILERNSSDVDYKNIFQSFINDKWLEKSKMLETVKQSYSPISLSKNS
jgi:1-acyl-sn-glycerol-3-phosphate acyltransferase